MKLALAQFNPPSAISQGTRHASWLWRRAPKNGERILPFSPSFVFAVTFPKIYWNVPPLSIEIKRMKQLAAKLPLPAIVGFVGKNKNARAAA